MGILDSLKSAGSAALESMGISDSLKSAGSAALGRAKRAGNLALKHGMKGYQEGGGGISGAFEGAKKLLNAAGHGYRNSLVYDFASIVRAKIYVFGYSVDSKFKFIETLPLQLNPQEYKKNKNFSWAMDNEKIMNGDSREDRDDSMELDLIFNIVDEYKLKTMESSTPIPINLDEVTIISKLFKYQNNQYRVLLKWGPLAYLSYISGVTCTYDSFSPFGEPLSARGTLTLSKHRSRNTFNATDVNLGDTLGGYWDWIKGLDFAERATVGIKSNIEASEALPNISSRLIIK